jgi:hypothetical protein
VLVVGSSYAVVVHALQAMHRRVFRPHCSLNRMGFVGYKHSERVGRDATEFAELA